MQGPSLIPPRTRGEEKDLCPASASVPALRHPWYCSLSLLSGCLAYLGLHLPLCEGENMCTSCPGQPAIQHILIFLLHVSFSPTPFSRHFEDTVNVLLSPFVPFMMGVQYIPYCEAIYSIVNVSPFWSILFHNKDHYQPTERNKYM